MTPSDQHLPPKRAVSGAAKGESPTLPGGYHSRGVPGEEGDVRKRMRVLKVGDKSQINRSRPLKGGAGAERAAVARLDAGQTSAGGEATVASVFVIVKNGADFLDTPVFRAGESGDEEAVALFTDRERAQHYLDRAGWSRTDELGELSPGDLLKWLMEAEQEGIRYVTVNPDRERHLAGDPQEVLSLNAMSEESADDFMGQVMELARG